MNSRETVSELVLRKTQQKSRLKGTWCPDRPIDAAGSRENHVRKSREAGLGSSC